MIHLDDDERRARLARRHAVAPPFRVADRRGRRRRDGLPARHRPGRAVPVGLGARRRVHGAGPGPRVLRRPHPGQAPGDAPDAVRGRSRPAAGRAGGVERPGRRGRAAPAGEGGPGGGVRRGRGAVVRRGDGGRGRRPGRRAAHRGAAPGARARAGGVDRVRPREVVGGVVPRGVARDDLPAGRGDDRAGREPRLVDVVATHLGAGRGLAGGADPVAPRGRRPGAAGRAVAAPVRARAPRST